MANTHKFIVKNGLRADNIEFTDSHSGSHQISLNMLNTDTLNFEGDAGSLFSITDDLTGSVFTVGDISGLPIIDVNGNTHNVTFNQFDGKIMIGGTDSGSTDSDILNVTGNIKTTGKITTTDSSIFAGNGSSGGVTISDGLIDIRTGTGLVSKVKFYCEASNAHFQTLQAAPHSASSDAVIVLPTASGTLLTTNGSAANLSQIPMAEASGTLAAANVGNLPASKITSGTFDSARLPAGAFGGGGGSSGVTVQDEGSALSTTGTTLNFVGSGVVASGTGATKTITIAGGASQNTFSTVAVAGQDNIVADGATDTLTIAAGSGMTITTTAGTDTITFASSGGGGGGGLDSAAVLTVAGSAALNAATVDGLSLSVVSSMPGSPDSDTIYFVTG
jgi:hypothetical protein